MTRLERRLLNAEWAMKAVAFRNNPDDPRHGTRRGYDYWGCDCGDCRRWNTDQHAARVAARRAKGNLPPGDPKHGANGYTNHGCLCDECRAANRARVARDRARRRAEGNLPPGDPRHGLNGHQNYGCTCDTCRGAARAAKAEARQRKREGTAA